MKIIYFPDSEFRTCFEFLTSDFELVWNFVFRISNLTGCPHCQIISRLIQRMHERLISFLRKEKDMPKGKNLPSKKVTAKKNPSADGKKVKKVEAPAGAETIEEEADEETALISPLKEKVIIEIEERDDVVGPVDKMVADPLLEAQSVSIDGAETEETGLDEEEIDPFGDKWEA